MITHRAPSEIPWLLVLFRRDLTLAWADSDIGECFMAGDELYEPVSDYDLLGGFYDRLYSPNGAFVGLQVTPLAIPDLAVKLADLSYVRTTEHDRQLRIFLTSSLPDQISEIIDQAFGGRMYRSPRNRFAISVDTYFLREHERVLIASGPARWETIRPSAT